MNWVGRFALAMGTLLVAAQGAAGCSDSGSSKGGEGRDEEGLAMCCELAAVCHEAGPQGADEAECHEIGHLDNPSECRANYDHCMDVCGHSGEGGQGGEPEGHSCDEHDE